MLELNSVIDVNPNGWNSLNLSTLSSLNTFRLRCLTDGDPEELTSQVQGVLSILSTLPKGLPTIRLAFTEHFTYMNPTFELQQVLEGCSFNRIDALLMTPQFQGLKSVEIEIGIIGGPTSDGCGSDDTEGEGVGNQVVDRSCGERVLDEDHLMMQEMRGVLPKLHAKGMLRCIHKYNT